MVGAAPRTLAAMLAAGVVACSFPTPSQDYICETDSDCEQGRVCSPQKFCVLGSAQPDAGSNSPMDAADASVDADTFAATRAACMAAGYTTEATTGGLYRQVTTTPSWTNAKTDCDNDVAGATHLIVLSTDVEFAYAKTFTNAWVGLTDTGTEGTFRNATGEVTAIAIMNATYWGTNQPDNGGGNENCAQMKATGLDDDQCGGNHRYTCECDGRMPTP